MMSLRLVYPYTGCRSLHFLNLVTVFYAIFIDLNDMKKRQGPEREAPSKVLLVCVYDTVIIEVTNEAAFTRFSPFGPIIKILIFERGEVTKFFLEYMQVQDAVKAKNFLDGSKLYESICKMNIYYSNFSSVDLKHETSQGVSLETLAYASAPAYYYYPHNFYNYPYLYNSSPNDQFVELTQGLNGLSLELEQKNLFPSFYSPANAPNWDQDTAPEAAQNLQETIQSNIDWLLRSQEKKTSPSIPSTEQLPKETQEKSCFLFFQLKEDLTNRNIYNLFSNFGNISYIKKTRKAVFIKFRSIQFAAMAKNYLQGYTLLGNPLVLSYVSNKSEAEPKEEEYSEITYFDSSFDRFTAQRSITINPPCVTLHVSSLKRQSCRVDNLRYIFEQFGQVEGVQILGSSYDKNMALVKFKNIEDSFSAIAQMHNRALLGRKVQISFTKSKLY